MNPRDAKGTKKLPTVECIYSDRAEVRLVRKQITLKMFFSSSLLSSLVQLSTIYIIIICNMFILKYLTSYDPFQLIRHFKYLAGTVTQTEKSRVLSETGQFMEICI